eukprot:Selendium_serpulae@DN5005_c0_g1_i2.p2
MLRSAVPRVSRPTLDPSTPTINEPTGNVYDRASNHSTNTNSSSCRSNHDDDSHNQSRRHGGRLSGSTNDFGSDDGPGSDPNSQRRVSDGRGAEAARLAGNGQSGVDAFDYGIGPSARSGPTQHHRQNLNNRQNLNDQNFNNHHQNLNTERSVEMATRRREDNDHAVDDLENFDN